VKDFLQNRPRVAAQGPEVHQTAAATMPTPLFEAALLGSAHTGSGAGHEPTVEAIKEGDRVVKLIVTCRCGEKIEILCAYAPNPR
jgi:hypothetical protein